MSTAGLIAAAGLSTRMGRPKAMLPVGASGIPFVWQLASVYVEAGLKPVIITIPDGEVGDVVEAMLKPLSINPAAQILCVRNDDPAQGFSGSVLTALVRAATSTGLVITPVDAPHATAALIGALVQGLMTTTADAVVAVVGQKRAHPVAFRKTMWRRLASCAARGGPATLLDELAIEGSLHAIPWGDWRVLEDINTPEDWERAFAMPFPGKAR
ncbi:MAG: nucleotidyltransferase family protein [Deltaproteobacteria bacterium]|nr:nucleotidyltransferase family protein [Deltaproteobacteria bacterium]